MAIFFALSADSQIRRIGILGSSSANGQGVPTDSAWAMKLKKYYLGLNLIDTLHRIAASTYDCYSGMPTGYVPPPGRNSPNISYNITRLMTRTPMPTTIIVSYPNTNYNIFSDQEILFCLDSIKKYANAMGAVCFIATTQPRDNYDDAGRARLKYLNDVIKNYFGYYAIDFFTPLYNPANNRLKPEYALGDGVHINSRGHEVLFQQVLAKNIFNIDMGSIQRVLIDIGQSATATISTDQWGKYWNNMTDSRKGVRISNAVTVNNQVTPLKLEVINPIGTTSSADAGVASGGATVSVQEYPASAVTDHAFANPTITNGRWRLYDLDPALTYSVKFWGNRNLSGYRIIQIKRSDETVWTEYNASLNTKYNQAAIFSFSGKTEMSFDIRVKSGSAQGCISLIDVITTLPLNQSPIADAGADLSVMLPIDSVQLNGNASFDPGGTIAQFHWKILSGPPGAMFSNGDIAEPVFRNLEAGIYILELEVKDVRLFSDKDTLQIKVEAPKQNQLPIVDAGKASEIFLPLDFVDLSGEALDFDGVITSSEWQQVSGPSPATIIQAHKFSAVAKNLIVGEYLFELIVTDDSLATVKDTIKVTVHPPNQLPLANAGIDGLVTLPNTFVLDGSLSSDPDGTITSYSWKKLSGPSEVVFSDSAVTTTVTGLVEGIYVFELTVTDNGNAINSDLVNVTVFPAPNRPPIASAGLDRTISLPKDSIHLNGVATDPDNNLATYNWTVISGPSAYIFNDPSFITPTVTGLIEGQYAFELTVTDTQGLSDKDTIVITVNSQPVIVNERILIDFGQATNVTASPDQLGKYWNNVTDTRRGIRLVNAITASNQSTSVKFEVINPIGTTATYDPGVSTGGPIGSVGDYPYSAATDNAFANINVTNGQWRFYDLNPNRIYTIKFWGSRNISGSRFIQIKTTEETTWKEYNASLNTDYNTAAVFTISGKTEVSFDIKVKSGSTFGYISVIDITSTANTISSPLIQKEKSSETLIREAVKIYPNPAFNNVTVELRDNYTGTGEILISNAQGVVLKQLNIIKPLYGSTYTIDIKSLPRGSYFLEIRMLDKKEVVRFIKL